MSFEGFDARKVEVVRGPRELGSKVKDSRCHAGHSLSRKLSLLLDARASSH